MDLEEHKSRLAFVVTILRYGIFGGKCSIQGQGSVQG